MRYFENLDLNTSEGKSYVMRIDKLADKFDNNYWDVAIAELRAKYGIPEEGYPTKDGNWDDAHNMFYLFEDHGDGLMEGAKKLAFQFNLPGSWGEVITYYTLYQFFFEPIMDPITSQYVESPGKFPELHIVVTERLNKTELTKFIKEKFDEIQVYMNKLPVKPRIHNFARPWLMKEIYTMRKVTKNKPTFKEISDCLCEKYSENEELMELVSSESYVKDLYHSWAKFLKENIIS